MRPSGRQTTTIAADPGGSVMDIPFISADHEHAFRIPPIEETPRRRRNGQARQTANRVHDHWRTRRPTRIRLGHHDPRVDPVAAWNGGERDHPHPLRTEWIQP